MNKVLVSITVFSPLWSPSSKLLHNELQYEIAITALTMFLQISNVIAERFSPNHRTISPSRRTHFLQIAEHVFSKSPMYFATCFLQIAEHFAPNLQDISPISEQHTFFSLLFGEDPVSDLSLHVPQAPRSVLWVVGCGSSVTPVLPTRPRAPRSTLWTMG